MLFITLSGIVLGSMVGSLNETVKLTYGGQRKKLPNLSPHIIFIF